MLTTIGWDGVYVEEMMDDRGHVCGRLLIDYHAVEAADEPELRLKAAWLELGIGDGNGPPVRIRLPKREAEAVFLRWLDSLFEHAASACIL